MEAKLNVPSVRPGTVPKTDVIAGLRASTDEPAQDKAPGRRAWKPGWGGHPSGVMPAHPSSGESGQHRAVRWRWADSAVEQGRGDDDRVPGAGSPAAQRGRAGGGRVYFAPEAHAAYEALGFAGSPVSQDGVARPELKSYFTSRGACMGQVPGEVVAAAFGCFNPKVVVPAVAAGWQITSREAVLQAREQGATAMLARVLGEQPEGLGRVIDLLRRAADAAPWAGHPICCGLRSLGFPSHPLGVMWRAADLLREHRGDSHVIAWAVGGADAVEVLLLTEQWWGLPARAYTPTRGWTAADMDAGFQRLTRRGLMGDDELLTDAGRAFREEIEVRTDTLERPVLEALGDDLEELLEHLDGWSEAVISAGSYPKRIAGVYNVGGGLHFGSGLTIDTAAEQYAKPSPWPPHPAVT